MAIIRVKVGLSGLGCSALGGGGWIRQGLRDSQKARLRVPGLGLTLTYQNLQKSRVPKNIRVYNRNLQKSRVW